MLTSGVFSVEGVVFTVVAIDGEITATCTYPQDTQESQKITFTTTITDSILKHKVHYAIGHKNTHLAIDEETYKSLFLAITYISLDGDFESYSIELTAADSTHTPLNLLFALFETSEKYTHTEDLEIWYRNVKKFSLDLSAQCTELSMYRTKWQDKYEQTRYENLEMQLEFSNVNAKVDELQTLSNKTALTLAAKELELEQLRSYTETLKRNAEQSNNEAARIASEMRVLKKDRDELLASNSRLMAHRNQLRKQNRQLMQERNEEY